MKKKKCVTGASKRRRRNGPQVPSVQVSSSNCMQGGTTHVIHALASQVELASKHNLGSLTYAEAFQERNIAWASFLWPGTDASQRRYEEVSDWGRVRQLLKDHLDDYNSCHTSTMDLVFFQAAINHVCRLCRVLQQVGKRERSS